MLKDLKEHKYETLQSLQYICITVELLNLLTHDNPL